MHAIPPRDHFLSVWRNVPESNNAIVPSMFRCTKALMLLANEIAHLEHGFVWCWTSDNSESRYTLKLWNVVLEKGGEEYLDISCEKWSSAQSQGGKGSRSFSIVIRFVGVCYGRLMAMRYKFKLVTYVLRPLVIDRRGGTERNLNEITAGSG